MRNLFKKSLTLCLVAILAFSCFAGIVSAENTFTATIAVDNQTITPGTTSVDVTLNITSSQIGINEALIEVSSDIGTIGSKAELVSSEGAASIQMPEGSTNYGSFYLSAENDISGETTVLGSVAAAKIKVTFTVAENKAPGTYPINIAVDGVRAASGNEDVITFTYATANVTVAEPHVHEYTYTPNGDKTHKGTCACNEAPITNEACVDGDDEDTLCDKCGGETADVVVPEHTHNYSYDYNADSHWTVCSNEDGLCDAVTTEKVAHSFDATTGVCACGFKMDNSVALGRGIVAENKVGVKLSVRDAVVESYDDYVLEMKIGYYDVEDTANPFSYNTKTILYKNIADGEETPEGYVKQTSYANNQAVWIHYVAAYEYTCPVEARVHLFDENGKEVAISKTWTFTVSDRILAAGIKNQASDAIYVDLMNYGKAVQEYFVANNSDSDLADAPLPTVGYENYQKYATPDSVASLETIATVNKGTASNGSKVVVGKGLLVEDSNILRFRINPNGDNVANCTLKVNFTDSVYGPQSTEIVVSDLDFDGTYYYYYSRNIALYDSETTVTAELYDGDTLLYTRIYSVESGLSEIKNTSPDVCKAIEKLTVSLWDTLPGLQGK